MTILDTIVATKWKEIEHNKSARPVSVLENMPLFSRETFSLRASLLDSTKTAIIAEFKRRSPSKGLINGTATPEVVTTQYTAAGASGLSVLTDSDYFGGSEADLAAARINTIPILRKDFIVDEYQILEAKAMGADVILLIAACLTPAEVKRLAAFAQSLQLEVLLELHDEAELEHMNAYTGIVGINNRNLKTFEVDIEKSMAMAEKIGKAAVRVAESGIQKAADVHMFRNAGFDAFLIGERFMKEPEPGLAFARFVEEINAAR
jgi:indole-3-glycerol phosphate synthase